MNGEVYKVLMVDGEKVLCIDEIDGFTLEIGGSRYHVYADEDGSTHVDQITSDGKEYIGKIDDDGTADEEEAALFILSLW